MGLVMSTYQHLEIAIHLPLFDHSYTVVIMIINYLCKMAREKWQEKNSEHVSFA